MDIVQSGAVHAIDLRAKQEELRETDQSYIQVSSLPRNESTCIGCGWTLALHCPGGLQHKIVLWCYESGLLLHHDRVVLCVWHFATQGCTPCIS